MNYFIVFLIYRLEPNVISTEIFEPLIINFIIIFMLIPSIKKFVILKSSKTEFGRPPCFITYTFLTCTHIPTCSTSRKNRRKEKQNTTSISLST